MESKFIHTGETEADPPRVFISYSYDNDAYKEWVASFAARLIEDGINARLDRWHLGKASIPDFMDREVRNADRVLMLCTPTYQQKIYEMQEGLKVTGSGWESMLITTASFSGSAIGKFIPIVTKGSWKEAVPSYAQGLLRYDLSADVFNEAVYDELLQHLHDLRPEAPVIGVRPQGLAPAPIPPLRGPEHLIPSASTALQEKVIALFDRAEEETLAVFDEDNPQPNFEISKLWRNVGDALHRVLSRERKGDLAERCYWKQEYWRNPKAYDEKYEGKRDHNLIGLARLRNDILSAFDQPLDATGQQPRCDDSRSEAFQVRPQLQIVYRKDGWYLENMGRGTALNIIVAQKHVKGESKGKWFNPVRTPSLKKETDFLLNWLGHENDTGIGASYEDEFGNKFTSICGNDLTRVSDETIFPDWPESEIRKHWHFF